MKNEQKKAVFKSFIGIGFTILCLYFGGKYAYPMILGVKLIGSIIAKQSV